MTPSEREAAFRALARDLDGIDVEVYAAAGLDPTTPVVGEGPADARLAFFGRDPGRTEIFERRAFVGAGGQLVRRALHDALGEGSPYTLEAGVRVGERVFWANTVPYKPVGNEAWSTAVKKRFQPVVADVLLSAWRGADVITLGLDAFLWFGLGDRAVTAALKAHQAREDRFTTSITVTLRGPSGARELRLHPLPHPSPLNATWYRRFPGLLRDRLDALGWRGA